MSDRLEVEFEADVVFDKFQVIEFKFSLKLILRLIVLKLRCV